MWQAAADACGFIEGMSKDDFLADKRTQQAVIMSLIIIGEATTKVMDQYAECSAQHPEVPWRSMRGMRNHIALLMAISISTSMSFGKPFSLPCRNCWSACQAYARSLLIKSA